MKRFEIECRTCGSTYEIGSDGSRIINTGEISCFVCKDKIFAYDGYISYYPFLKQRKEKHNKFDANAPLPDQELFDRESNG